MELSAADSLATKGWANYNSDAADALMTLGRLSHSYLPNVVHGIIKFISVCHRVQLLSYHLYREESFQSKYYEGLRFVSKKGYYEPMIQPPQSEANEPAPQDIKH